LASDGPSCAKGPPPRCARASSAGPENTCGRATRKHTGHVRAHAHTHAHTHKHTHSVHQAWAIASTPAHARGGPTQALNADAGKHTHARMHTQRYRHRHTHTYTHTHTHTHTHAHTQAASTGEFVPPGVLTTQEYSRLKGTRFDGRTPVAAQQTLPVPVGVHAHTHARSRAHMHARTHTHTHERTRAHRSAHAHERTRERTQATHSDRRGPIAIYLALDGGTHGAGATNRPEQKRAKRERLDAVGGGGERVPCTARGHPTDWGRIVAHGGAHALHIASHRRRPVRCKASACAAPQHAARSQHGDSERTGLPKEDVPRRRSHACHRADAPMRRMQ
jgi:hypothetical protein